MGRPMDLGMATVKAELMTSSTGSSGSAPTSPKTDTGLSGTTAALASSSIGTPSTGVLGAFGGIQTHPLNLTGASSLQRPSHYNVELLRTASSGGMAFF